MTDNVISVFVLLFCYMWFLGWYEKIIEFFLYYRILGDELLWDDKFRVLWILS